MHYDCVAADRSEAEYEAWLEKLGLRSCSGKKYCEILAILCKSTEGVLLKNS
jgi:hypothetical protein